MLNIVRKLLSSAAALALVLAAFAGGQSFIVEADEGIYDSMTYVTVDEDMDGVFDYVKITACDQSVTEVEIPSKIKGLPVTIIEEAFYGCENLTSITIPESVTSIGDLAFFYCKNLTSITIPDGVTSIGVNAFGYCTSLTSITIPNSVTSIGDLAFFYCKNLTSITIPDGVTSIGVNAFGYCTSLTSITIPNSVTSIGNYALEYCTSLTSITIPDSVASIGNGAFYYCDILESITIPEGITSIGDKTFSYCNLTSIEIPDSVISIGNSAFAGTSLVSITIPDSVISIGGSAFMWCTDLKNITIENPKCEIADSQETIYTMADQNGNYFFKGTIYGYENSTAQEYAEKYDKNFESLGEKPIVITVSDIVKFQKWLVKSGNLMEEEFIKYDLYKDSKLNIFDLIILKRKII